MADSIPTPEASPTLPGPAIEQARRIFRASEEAEAAQDRDRYLEQLKTYLAFVESRRAELSEFAPELGQHLDLASMAFYRMSQPDLAARAIDVGLTVAPRQASLLHHKAM
ncbi:MAG TPA: hypothetical protein VLY85_02530, partial [Thermoplasmata archaeon]|nr:hypothetical protein [Thermoplasmata archaeon]